LFVGPVFSREAVTTPRRPRHYAVRAVYVVALLILMCTAWLVVAGTQIIRNVGDMARFGSILFGILAPLQLALMAFLAALVAASAVSQEKDRRTLILMLMTRMTNSELVLGKLLASLLNIFAMLAAALPLFMLIPLFGGVSFEQVARVFGVTLTTALVAGSLGSMLALWREKTFQTLAMTALALVIWVGVWEGVHLIAAGRELAGIPVDTWVAAFSPLRAIFAASRPDLASGVGSSLLGNGDLLFMIVSLAGAAILNAIAVVRVRAWNPSREVRPGQAEQAERDTIWGVEHDLAQGIAQDASPDQAEVARAAHVDARVHTASTKSRRVWDNPVLWREVCTWAYGRKVLVIRFGYLLLFAMAAAGLHFAIGQGSMSAGNVAGVVPLAALFLVSLVLVNALAVTSITGERDGQALDLLLVTDLSPKEFVFGKLSGVFWVTKEMVVLPMLLCVYLWWTGGVSLENLVYLLIGLAVMYVFVNMLGIHCGMNYANSRAAIGVSLGVVFFLFLGVVTCILIMISFSGSFQTQLWPFLAFILGGGVGLYVSLGHRNPSPAILAASLLLPIFTFYSITSFLLYQPLAVCLVTAGTYGFTTAAMMIPAIHEFDIAMGRTKTPGEE